MPLRYHNIWRDKHDPYDPYHPYNKFKDVDDRPWRKWPGWDYEKPRPDWYYTRPFIETDRGNIRGYNITVGKIRMVQSVYPNEDNYLYKMISIFLGIPYALPPGEELDMDEGTSHLITRKTYTLGYQQNYF